LSLYSRCVLVKEAEMRPSIQSLQAGAEVHILKVLIPQHADLCLCTSASADARLGNTPLTVDPSIAQIGHLLVAHVQPETLAAVMECVKVVVQPAVHLCRVEYSGIRVAGDDDVDGLTEAVWEGLRDSLL